VPESTPLSVDVKGRPEDRKALAKAFRVSRHVGGRLPMIVAASAFAVVVVFGRPLLLTRWQFPEGYAATLAAFVGLVIFLTVFSAFGSKRARDVSDPRGTFLKGFRITLDDDGVHIDGENFRGLHRWAGILRLQETDTHMFLYTDGAQAIIVPKRCFASGEIAARFASVVRDRLAAAA
jgi:hypothetical protein